jgi:hypothetical protein
MQKRMGIRSGTVPKIVRGSRADTTETDTEGARVRCRFYVLYALAVEPGESYRALQGADEQSVEDLAGLVRVANILECFCRVLAANVEENFLTASVGQY